MEFKALACQRKYLKSCSTKECQIPSGLSYRGCRIEDLAIDLTVPGYPEYVLSLESRSDNVSDTTLHFPLAASQQIEVFPKLLMLF
jgi:E3 ubiquitin-protein ligase TRIP12